MILVQLFEVALLIVLIELTSLRPLFAGYELQSPCIQSAVGDTEILATRSLDVDKDGKLDEIVIYGGDDLYLSIASDSLASECKIVLNEYLTFRRLINGFQSVTIRNIELMEVTGDTYPDLHVWLEKRNGGPRQEVALHAIYSRQSGRWEEVLRVTQCLAISSFEIREEQRDGPKALYLEEDKYCNWPFSNERTYTIMRWNGSRFLPSISGTINIPMWQRIWDGTDLLCSLSVVLSILVLLGLIWIVHNRIMTNTI